MMSIYQRALGSDFQKLHPHPGTILTHIGKRLRFSRNRRDGDTLAWGGLHAVFPVHRDVAFHHVSGEWAKCTIHHSELRVYGHARS